MYQYPIQEERIIVPTDKEERIYIVQFNNPM